MTWDDRPDMIPGHKGNGDDWEKILDQIERMSAAGLGILARGRRITASTTTTTIVGVLRLDGVTVEADRLIHVYTGGLHLDSSVANDVVEAEIRFTTDGTNATTTSTVLPGARTYGLQVNAAWPETRIISTHYVPSSNETLSLLLCVTRKAGTGNVSIFADGDHFTEMMVADVSEDPTDTGVDI